MFFSWANRLPEWIEVCPVNLPGRSKRMFEPAYLDMESLQVAMVPKLPLADKPFAVFGHSLGAQIAFELAHRAHERYGIEPLHVFVSGCFAPHLDHPHPIHHLGDAEFMRELRELGGVPREVADDSELMELMKPMLRADFTIAETYHRPPVRGVSCAMTAFAGEQDPIATVEAAGAWRDHTGGPFELKAYPGDHFFIHKVEDDLVRSTASTLGGHFERHVKRP